MAEPIADLKTDAVKALLKRRAAELEEEFLHRLHQMRYDFAKAREQLLFLEKGCDAAESAMKRAKAYLPVIDREYACPNCYVRMNIPGTLCESPPSARDSIFVCRKCSASFHIPQEK